MAALAEYEDANIPVAVENAADDLVTDLAICEKALQEEFFVLVENDDGSAAAPEPQAAPEQQAAPVAPTSRESPKSGETTSAGTLPAGTGPETTIDEYVVLSDPAAAAAPATPTTATIPALTLRRKTRKEATPRHPPPTATPRRLPPTPTDSSAAAPTATTTALATNVSHKCGSSGYIGCARVDDDAKKGNDAGGDERQCGVGRRRSRGATSSNESSAAFSVVDKD